ncbi:protein-disulfide isomerase [Herbihabitans rhizosphaerae]|uniref:Protein-disulfide isomerase n=1 Tax=Herbihabitans rhizosphaerae TaxID=1872711 RepID=A0A4Q7KHH0_9PSEU|nr:thioredoxin domain-containing protein [Herbihabitans rhizosphaerae]RZS33984.1 protein-disulfide isomerase [Herbihabitans rhizosphaerae]
MSSTDRDRRGAAVLAAAQRERRRRRLLTGAIAVAVVAAVVVVGLLATDASKNETEGQTIRVVDRARLLPEHAGARDGVVVVSGSPTAKITLDVYADFLCPVCAKFHESSADRIDQLTNEGVLRVRYHMVPLLEHGSDPPGYSVDAANASLCAADAGRFVPFHDSLLAGQPREGGRGYDKGQLTTLGRDVGITAPAFAECVQSGRYDQRLRDELARTVANPALGQPDGSGRTRFGTPTVVANGTLVRTTDADWLAGVLSARP